MYVVALDQIINSQTSLKTCTAINLYTELPTIMISAESLPFSVLHYTRTLKTIINLPFPLIIPYGAVLTLS